jgi:hypothetical protein
MALVAVQTRTQTVTLIVTSAVTIGIVAMVLPALADPLGDRFGVVPALVMLGVLAWAMFVLAVAVVAILPPLLLPGRDRAVLAAHSWLGAREVRRAFGRASRAIGLPTDARSAEAWLARTPASDRLRFVRVGALLMAGRFEEARTETALLPAAAPLDAYRKLEARALIADQTGDIVDEAALRAAVHALPAGMDRTEATVSLAVFRARRALPDGDWRAPLLEARGAIPESDLRLLIVDFGLPIFEILFRRAALPFAALLAIIGASVTVLPGVAG